MITFKVKYGPNFNRDNFYEVNDVAFEVQLQSIINASFKGAIITLPPGIYTISKTIEINSDNITIDGEGQVTLKQIPGKDFPIFKINSKNNKLKFLNIILNNNEYYLPINEKNNTQLSPGKEYSFEELNKQYTALYNLYALDTWGFDLTTTYDKEEIIDLIDADFGNEELSKLFLKQFKYSESDGEYLAFTPSYFYDIINNTLEDPADYNLTELLNLRELVSDGYDVFLERLGNLIKWEETRPIKSMDLPTEAISAAYRIAAIQIRKSFTSLATVVPSPSLQEFFQTELGKDLLNLSLGYGLDQFSNHHIQQLGEECRIAALTNTGNRLLEEFFEQLLPQLPVRIALPDEEIDEEEDYQTASKKIVAT